MTNNSATTPTRRLDDHLPSHPLQWEGQPEAERQERIKTAVRLESELAAAGAAFLAHMGTGGGIAAIPHTGPAQYVVAGTMAAISKVLGEQMQSTGDLSDEQIIELHDSMFPSVLFERDKIMGNVVQFARAVIAALASQSQAAQQPSEHADLAQPDLLNELRRWAGVDEGYASALIRKAADEIDRLITAKSNLIQHAQNWAAEAKGQHSIVIDILRHFGLPENDWEAKSLIVAHIAGASQDKPAECSGTPSSCPDNEGHGCACGYGAPEAGTSQAAKAQADEILSLHRHLAAEKLRADQGWQRADAKSKECIELRERMAATKAQAEPIYQTVEGEFGESWGDTDKAGYDAANKEGILTRIVYSAPVAKEAPAVPAVKTQAMLNAGAAAFMGGGTPAAIFDAMLAAAPVASVAVDTTREAETGVQANVLPPFAAPVSQPDADEATTNALYLDIMNITCDESKANEEYSDRRIAYKHGHRDARHAAADLIAEFASGFREGRNTKPKSAESSDRTTTTSTVSAPAERTETPTGCRYPLCQSEAEQARIAAEVHRQLYTGEDGAPASAAALSDGGLECILEAFAAEADADKLMPDGGMERLTAFDYFKRGWVRGSSAAATPSSTEGAQTAPTDIIIASPPCSTSLGAQKAPEEVRNQALKFADQIITDMFEVGDLDGGTVQDMAVARGLLAPKEMPEPCGEDGSCQCAQNEAEFPTTCYRKTYLAELRALRTTSTDQANADTGSAE